VTGLSGRARGAAAFHFGPGHVVMHGNPPFLAEFGPEVVGQPAREALVGLPDEAFEVMDLVLRTGRGAATDIETSHGPRRLVVVPRRAPDEDAPYGVTTCLRA
jgi:hypothetical protein